MINVAVSTNIPIGSLEKLCPGSELCWGDCAFTLNPSDVSSFDYWIIWAGLARRTTLQVAPCNTLFIAGEPPAKKVYPRRFYQQFHRLVCTKGDYPHDQVHFDALGLNWHLGYDRVTGRYAYGYDHLAAMTAPDDKQNKVSVVCSNLSTTQGQRDRLALLTKLKEALGDRIIHFGRGFTPIEDKLDAILPYRYHLVLENSISDDYWTEKLSDAYLGWALPLYVGCENVDRYVSSESLVQLTGQSIETMVELIQQQLDAGLSGAQQAGLAKARDAVLNQYNPFARFAHWAERLYEPSVKREPVTMQPHKAFRILGRGLLYRARQRMRGA
ncbi:MAG: glycosyltransferase family 10 [Planctomycetota bacterium]